MREHRRNLAALGTALLCSAMIATAPAAAVSAPESIVSDVTHGRRPQRTSTRATSLEWMPDVDARLRALSDHAADAARTHRLFGSETSPLGRLHPQPPAAGDGAQP